VQANGGRIYEETRVVSVDSGEPCRVETEHGTVTADTVLFATHTPAGFSLLHAELEPLRSYVLGVRLRGAAPPDGLFFDTADPYNYTRRQGDLLIVGGKDHKTGEGDPEESYRELEEYVRQRWDVESIDYRWSAQFYDPPDGLPMIGRALTSGHVFVATGYSGVGMVFGTLGGMLLSDFALGRENPWAEVYRPSRIKPLAAGPQVAKLNLEVAATFVKDRLTVPKIQELAEVPLGEGRVVEIGGEKAAVYRDPSGAVHAVSPVCTHAGCFVHWNSAETSWDCPCHGSRFGIDGGILEGPAVKELAPVAVKAASPAR
jgi:Rieske Fe-S protein